MKSFIWKFPKIKETLSRMIATGQKNKKMIIIIFTKKAKKDKKIRKEK
jgi:hypothetical protein